MHEQSPEASFIRMLGGPEKALAWLSANRERLETLLLGPSAPLDRQKDP
jgi:hypothetical protein